MGELVPPVVQQATRHGLPILDRRWHGRFLAEATLVGPEARGSSPVRMVRDDTTRAAPGHRGALSRWRRCGLRRGHRQRRRGRPAHRDV